MRFFSSFERLLGRIRELLVICFELFIWNKGVIEGVYRVCKGEGKSWKV